jgi:ubiquinone/menaquinone biosynthesis C-methylase UbiE
MSIRKLNDAHAQVYDVVANFSLYREHIEQILMELEPEKGKLYLDLGCGTGNLLDAACKIDITIFGVDLSWEMLKKAKMKSKNLVMADLHHLPFRKDCIDGITNVNVFYQLNTKVFLKEVYRILKPGGKIVISAPKPGKSYRYALGIFKTVVRNPKILTNLRELVKFDKINKKILDTYPDALYEREELEKMLKDFEIKSIKKAYMGQNWLISGRKPAK